MLPEFPKFKSIELTDKEDVEKITHQYPPYSDFNFVSMWSWDIKGEMRISQLHGNLVVRFTDYLTNEPFYSFLGNNKVNETAEALLQLSVDSELKPRLLLIPDDIVASINRSRFKVVEDADNFDYVFDLKEISTYSGGDFSGKRNKVNKFLRENPEVKIASLVLTDSEIQKEILELDKLWLKNKILQDVNLKFKNEFLAANRFFTGDLNSCVGIGLYIENKMIAYSISDILPGNFATSHFSKADTNFTGIFEYLMRENAKFLLEKECKFLNFEQDLGLPGLRESKKSLASFLMRKYIISFVG